MPEERKPICGRKTQNPTHNWNKRAKPNIQKGLENKSQLILGTNTWTSN